MDRNFAALRLALTVAGFAILAAAPLLPAQSLPLGVAFRANTYTTAVQLEPRAASAGDGAFVVVWASDGQDGDGLGIFGQRFDTHGAPAGTEFRVNTSTASTQGAAAVAVGPAGGFVVVWESYGQDGSGYGIFGQRFDESGAKLSSEFQVNSYTTGYQSHPAIAIADSGAFVVVWDSAADQDGSRSGVFGQRFTAAGVKAGGEFRVNTVTFGDQYYPSVGIDGAGRSVVVWTSFDFDDLGIFGQRFDASGTKIGSEFPVNDVIAGKQRFPAIAVDRRSNFVVAWQGPEGETTLDTDVFARTFNGAAEKIGEELVVNDHGFKVSESRPSVAVGRAGNFTVAWDAYQGYLPQRSHTIDGQRLDRTGNKVGTNFQLSSGSHDSEISIAHGDAGLVAAWRGIDGTSSEITCRRQIFTPEALAVDSHPTPNTASDANGVFEPYERPLIEPTWRNDSPFTFDTAGIVTVSGPAGASYILSDDSASYGLVAPDSAASCANGNPDACYIALIFGLRPATHWDATLKETPNVGIGAELWKLHLGGSFDDVPPSQPFYRKIEALLHNGITSGCTATEYCPGLTVSRGQMGIFIAKAMAGGGELVPTAGVLSGQPYKCSPGGVSRFSDVAPIDSFCRHVHYLGAQNVTLGCVASQYCPNQAVTRDAMASFIAKAIVAPGGGNAVPLTYTDPITTRSYSCSSGSPNLHFSDVPVSNAFCKHIHYLWARGIVAGCSATTYCPASPVARDAMAKFIANGFGLQLYGP